ncbi:MAG: DNA polymerase I, partial [bacterium]
APRILSGDRDLLQIATEKTQIILPKTKGGETVYERYFAADVLREMGVTPEAFVDMKALMGDSSDNIPGLPGVGPKTASAIIAKYGSIENAKLHEAEITPKKARQAMEEHYDLAELSKELAKICTDAPLAVAVRDLTPGDMKSDAVREVYRRLGFRSFLSEFAEKAEEKKGTEIRVVNDVTAAEETFAKAEAAGKVGLSVVAGKKELYAVGLAFGEEAVALVPEGFLTEEYLCEKLSVLTGKIEQIASMNIKEILKQIDSGASADGEKNPCPSEQSEESREQGTCHSERSEESREGNTCPSERSEESCEGNICPSERSEESRPQEATKYFDAVIAAYLIDPLKSDWDFGAIAGGFLGQTMPGRSELLARKTPDDFLAAAAKKGDEAKARQTLAELAAKEASVALLAEEALLARLRDLGMEKLFYEVEMPLVPVLAAMEKAGIYASREELVSYGQMLDTRIKELESSIYEEAGEEFNLNSPKQLGNILFEKMHLPGGKKTKTGYSTAADVLEALAPDAPIVAKILEYRTYSKLKSTYADGLLPCIEEDGRIRTTFNQTITATGRLSSTDPNLQNIPMRMELGRQIRRCFFPKEGCIFVDADYSQIELRILAHMSGDEKLIDAYKNARDIHRTTAAEVFHVPFDEVSDELRRKAKAVNFGIVYGISSFGLSQGLSISRQEAAAYIKEYFTTYPRIHAFLQGLVVSAKKEGAAYSMFGRRRPVPELASANFAQRSFGERIAMNSPIQGSAADIIKIAMVRVYRRLQEEKMRSRLILQIHDELLIEAPSEEAEKAKAILEEEMKA